MIFRKRPQDYYWTKFVFSNLRYPVKSADLIIGGKNHPMKLVGGYWGAWTGPIKGDTSFKITEENGYTVTWPEEQVSLRSLITKLCMSSLFQVFEAKVRLSTGQGFN